ncbi:DUF5753 domain-containing protein [Streptosporangium sp. NPDC049078]|uniref:DUF5753 domain-containing protein n=1 Tax=Streptosporangium sp. NPDC049078 TaxID=3155767 RepID=UPI00342BA67D
MNLLGSKTSVLHVLMDEGALNRPIGTPEIMTDQLNDLLRIMDWPNVTIQILPLANGAHTGLEGAFSVLGFGDEDPEIGYAECPAGEVYVEAMDQVRRLMLMFERLADSCLSPQESTKLIAAMRSKA